MNAGTTIKKIFFIALWLCIGGGMLTLLLAAISKKNKGKCSDYVITLKTNTGNYFIDKEDVEMLLKKHIGEALIGQPVASFNLQLLEQELEHNTWIRDAELYFDNKEVLHITVLERDPVARIFTTTGSSFYIDSLGSMIPLSDKLSARVPVFTGFPGKKTLTAKDSVLLEQVRSAASFIINDPFWMAQVSQLDIMPDRNFEMVPVIGDHRVRMGNGEDIRKKFRRLFIFYKQVLSQTGFDKYKVIDVQFAGQVITSEQGGHAKVDSIQLRKNVEKLLRHSRDAENDTVYIERRLPIKPMNVEVDSAVFPIPQTQVSALPTDPNPVKTTSVSRSPVIKKKKAVLSRQEKPAVEEKKREPKAIMPAKPVIVNEQDHK